MQRSRSWRRAKNQIKKKKKDFIERINNRRDGKPPKKRLDSQGDQETDRGY